jgi:hypothetical protein
MQCKYSFHHKLINLLCGTSIRLAAVYFSDDVSWETRKFQLVVGCACTYKEYEVM